jgi:HEAT repeat protein
MSEIILKQSMIEDLNSISEKKQIISAYKLGDYDTEHSKKLLIETLSTLNSFVRDAVVDSLVRIGDVEFLCAEINHKHRYVRRGIVQALGRLGGSIACEQIIECLEDNEWGVRMYAAEAIGKVGTKEHINFLLQLNDDEHEWPREEARKSIKKLRKL